jgi:hypothetical protein
LFADASATAAVAAAADDGVESDAAACCDVDADDAAEPCATDSAAAAAARTSDNDDGDRGRGNGRALCAVRSLPVGHVTWMPIPVADVCIYCSENKQNVLKRKASVKRMFCTWQLGKVEINTIYHFSVIY